MKRRPRMTRHNRLRLTLLAVLALLCQQVAFAAYVCPATAMPATNTAMSADCNAMLVAPPTPDTQAATTLCVLHSGQPSAVTNNVPSPTVPPLLLPAMFPTSLPVTTLPAARTAQVRDSARRAPGLPPPLQHRVLLI